MTEPVRIQLTDGPCTVHTMFRLEAPDLWPREVGEKITFEPPLEMAEGDELWSDLEEEFWVVRGGEKIPVAVKIESARRSAFHTDVKGGV